MSYNKVILKGNLVRNPEVKDINGTPLCKITLAVSEKYKNRESVLFMDCEIWGIQAANVGKYLTKGNPVLIEGKLKQDAYEDASGAKRVKTVVVTSQVVFLGGKNSDHVDDNAAYMPMGKNKEAMDIDAFTGQGEMPF